MAGLTHLKQQHSEILELFQVLSVVLREEALCRTATVDELYQRMMERIDTHLLSKDQAFSRYLTHENEDIRKRVSDFLSGSKTIRNIYSKYKKDWRSFDERCTKHAAFVKDTEEFFGFMKKRIHDDEERCAALLADL